ncbi:MAG: alanine--tRNA ligase, partial [Alistipes sp.]|nr:alanine--tRNA ligase [Alistipes sp.]
DWKEIIADAKSEEFVGYDTLEADIRIARVRKVQTKNKVSYQMVFDKTPFYGNSGGQVGDTGYIESANEKIEIVATEKENGLIIHIANQLPENLEAEFHAVVNPAKRQCSANNHTATHLLHAALRKVLGSHVEQKGSMVSPDSLRFDFSHFQKMTDEEIRAVEREVNEKIRLNSPLDENREATQEEAQKAGAMMLFGEKYGDKVRMVRFGESVELCGGTHTSATGNIGMFKIVSEAAISAGVRRIEAVTGEKAEATVYAAQDLLAQLGEMLGNSQLVPAIKRLVENNESLAKEVEAMQKEQLNALTEKIVEGTTEENGYFVVARQLNHSADFVKNLAYNLRTRKSNLVMVVGSVVAGKATLTIMLGDDVVAKGVDAGAVVREAAKLIQGGGGGQKFFATAGGKNPDGIVAAIDKAKELIFAALQ